MEHISMKDIYQGGLVYSTDMMKTIYLTPEDVSSHAFITTMAI